MFSVNSTADTIVILIDDTSYSDINSLLIQQQLVRAAQERSAEMAVELLCRPEPLMYKGWMTPEQYNKYLYLQLLKSNVKSIKAKGHNYIGDLKTFRRYQRR